MLTATLRKYVCHFSGRAHTQTFLYLLRATDLLVVLFPIFARVDIFYFTLRFIVSVLLPHLVILSHQSLQAVPDLSKVFVSYRVTLVLKFHLCFNQVRGGALSPKLIAVISM